MDKTININLGGLLLRINEDAYHILHDYLQSINLKFHNTPGGNETIDDIESRIAEIFQSQKGQAGVITKENVEEMMGIIGNPEDFDLSDNEEHDRESSNRHKSLFRNSENAVIAGVCGGIGAYLNTDPVWIRLLFIIFTFVFGIGLLVYLALWIAVPSAVSGSQKREMYGEGPNYAMPGRNKNYHESRTAGALTEFFNVIGKILFIIVRIFLIAFGVVLVAFGFLALLTFLMVFILRYPWAFSTGALGTGLFYVPDFLSYIVTPNLVGWISVLMVIVVSLPLLAFIYGGIRLIFWFRVKDGIIWFCGFIIWIVSTAALSIMLFNEGISFAETGYTMSRQYLDSAPDTLYIRAGKTLSGLNYDEQISLPGDDYNTIYISSGKKEVYFRAKLSILDNEEDNSAIVEIRKRSSGRSRIDARRKSEQLIYNYRISGNTVFLDEYFTIPPDKKWSFDLVSVRVRIPEGTVVYMDKTTEDLYYSRHYSHYYNEDSENRFWLMTEDGFRHTRSHRRIK